MRQKDFEVRHGEQWKHLEAELKILEEQKPAGFSQLGTFPRHYRQVCHHLALARERQYAPQLIDRLDKLVQEGHRHFYRASNFTPTSVLLFLTGDFPALVRTERKMVWLAFALLYVPMIAMALTVYFAPQMAYTMFDHASLTAFDNMYDPHSGHIGRERGSDSDFMMFGYYVKNNIGISFQTFSGGLLYGLGSLFYLIYNGLVMGAVAGHLTNIQFGSTFYPFVVGHGAFELTAIALSGAAGLKLGFALIAPGRKKRLAALRDAAHSSVRIMYGVVVMLLIAAMIEAFWSSLQMVSPAIKYATGATLWLLVVAYFTFAGRSRAA